jgi:hypothetical protein
VVFRRERTATAEAPKRSGMSTMVATNIEGGKRV